MNIKQILGRVLVLVAACVLFAASASATTTIASITVTAPSTTLKIGAKQTLTAVAKDSKGHAIGGVTFTWGSSNSKLVSVTRGVTKALAVGSAKISATAGGKTGSVTITVPKPTALSGVAATGTAISGATVTLVDKKGTTLMTTTDGSGNYTLDTTGLKPPFMVKVQVGTNPGLYSVSADTETASVINVDPLTDLIIRSWYSVQGTTVDTAFTSPVANPPPTATQVQLISNVVVQVTALWLQQAGVDTTTFNPINTVFAADGTGVDLVLSEANINTDADTITITDGTTTQDSTVSYNPDTSSMSVATTTTNSITEDSSSSVTGTVVTTTTDLQNALTGITTALNSFSDIISAKGSALASTDLTPFLDAKLINDGLNKTLFADSTADQFRGLTLSFQILNINSLDTTNGLADVSFTVSATEGDQTQAETAEFFFKKQSDGSWRLYGDQLPAKFGVQSEMRTSQGFITGDSGADINVDIRPIKGAYTGLTIDGGDVFNDTVLTTGSTEVDVYTPNPAKPGTTVEVDRDAFFANTGVLVDLVPAGTPMTITMTPQGGGANQIFTVKTNAFTTESISITNLSDSSLAGATLGKPLHVVWTLPTTFAIAEVRLGALVFDGDQTSNTTISCDVNGPIVSITDTSADITIPTTCAGNSVVQANINLEVMGVNGERETVIYSFGNPAGTGDSGGSSDL